MTWGRGGQAPLATAIRLCIQMCYSYSTVRRASREKQVVRGAREVREVTKAAAALGCRRRVRGRMERGSYTTIGRVVVQKEDVGWMSPLEPSGAAQPCTCHCPPLWVTGILTLPIWSSLGNIKQIMRLHLEKKHYLQLSIMSCMEEALDLITNYFLCTQIYDVLDWTYKSLKRLIFMYRESNNM